MATTYPEAEPLIADATPPARLLRRRVDADGASVQLIGAWTLTSLHAEAASLQRELAPLSTPEMHWDLRGVVALDEFGALLLWRLRSEPGRGDHSFIARVPAPPEGRASHDRSRAGACGVHTRIYGERRSDALPRPNSCKILRVSPELPPYCERYHRRDRKHEEKSHTGRASRNQSPER